MNDFHDEGAPRTRLQNRLIMKINSRLIDNAAHHVQVGTWLCQGRGDKLPELSWDQLGIKLPYDVEKRLWALSQDPWMTDPEDVVYFPENRDTLIALYEFLQLMRSVGRRSVCWTACTTGRSSRLRSVKGYGNLVGTTD